MKLEGWLGYRVFVLRVSKMMIVERMVEVRRRMESWPFWGLDIKTSQLNGNLVKDDQIVGDVNGLQGTG
jgi:hypothetical protein